MSGVASALSYTIEKADLSDPATDLEIRQMVKAAFKEEALRPAWHIHNNIDSNASRPSFILVAKENGAIIGCDAFIANDFYLDGQHYVGYQICWTTTHPDHQGKRVTVNIINEAKRLLADEGAGFLYGLPNDNSRPIYAFKLNFTEYENMYTQIINVPFFRALYLQKDCEVMTAGALMIDEEQLYAHKKKQKGESILRVDLGDSFIWGKMEERKKLGITFRIFIVGGIKFSRPEYVGDLLAAVFKKYKPGFIELVSCRLNTTNACFKKWKKAPSLNAFIYYNLNMPEDIRLNLMFGAVDVF